jgi:SAM-dependent methyltransferase
MQFGKGIKCMGRIHSRKNHKRFSWAVADGAKRYMASVIKFAENADALEISEGVFDVGQKLLTNTRSYTRKDISEIPELNTSPLQKLGDFEKVTTPLPFADDCFDLVFGNGIIHRTDTETSAKEFCRVLRGAGQSIFWEPLGTNPIINVFRSLTPNARTKDDRPLTSRDFDILHRYFKKVEVKYYGFFTIACLPFQNATGADAIFASAKKIDHFVLSLPGMRRLAWYALITCCEPKKAVSPLVS